MGRKYGSFSFTDENGTRTYEAPPPPRGNKRYNVLRLDWTGYTLVGSTDVEEEAWNLIGQSWDCYEVHDQEGNICAEFIPY